MDNNLINNTMLESEDINSSSANVSNIDNLFENLAVDIESVNNLISNLSVQKKENSDEEQKIALEREKLEKAKLDFQNYISLKNDEAKKTLMQKEQSLATQKECLSRAEAEFKSNMDNSLIELELAKKELEIQREKVKEEKKQFETYKSLEINRIKHSEDILLSEKEQFEKYKAVTNEKIDLETKNLEQKCSRFKEIIGQFNNNFRSIIENKGE